MSYKPEVKVDGCWSGNALVFQTFKEAANYAENLYMRWTVTTGH